MECLHSITEYFLISHLNIISGALVLIARIPYQTNEQGINWQTGMAGNDIHVKSLFKIPEIHGIPLLWELCTYSFVALGNGIDTDTSTA